MALTLIPFDFAHVDRNREYPVLLQEGQQLEDAIWYQSAVRYFTKSSRWEYMGRLGWNTSERAVLAIQEGVDIFMSFAQWWKVSFFFKEIVPGGAQDIQAYKWLSEWMPACPITEERYF